MKARDKDLWRCWSSFELGRGELRVLMLHSVFFHSNFKDNLYAIKIWTKVSKGLEYLLNGLGRGAHCQVKWFSSETELHVRLVCTCGIHLRSFTILCIYILWEERWSWLSLMKVWNFQWDMVEKQWNYGIQRL